MTLLPTTAAPDGTPVGPYLVLPAQEEAELIHRALPAGSAVLELGCGTGRISRQLVDRGYRVHAIDQASSMIEHLHATASLVPICADIETLQLGETFGGIVLASYLVNVVDSAKRASFLATCRRHVTDDGVVVIQRLDPRAWWTPGAESVFGSVRVLLAAADVRDQILDARIEYQIGEQVFPQIVAAQILDDAALFEALDRAGFIFDRWHDAQRTWLTARPVACSFAR